MKPKGFQSFLNCGKDSSDYFQKVAALGLCQWFILVDFLDEYDIVDPPISLDEFAEIVKVLR